MNWREYPNFSAREFRCSFTGKLEMKPDFMALLQRLRTEYGKPMVISSGYRHPTHPIEAAKAAPGAHSSGQAADVQVAIGEPTYELVRLALALGFTGIGISQKAGRPRFVHLDTLPRKAIWSY
jgi:zinc D-Ala-D-Ala carboxypeptidase